MDLIDNDTDLLTTRLAGLLGKQVTFRLVGGGNSWGPYELVEFDRRVMVVRGSRDYLVNLSQVTVLHEGAKPTADEHYARQHGVSVPGMPGITIEDDADTEDDEE